MLRDDLLGETEITQRAPVITCAASFASGTPIALLTNGIVRDARGFTSST
jgi:hypothetical protein